MLRNTLVKNSALYIEKSRSENNY